MPEILTCWPRSSVWTGTITGRLLGNTELVDAVKLLARARQTAVWERTRHVLQLRFLSAGVLPAAVEAFEDLAAKDPLRLLARAPSPSRAAKPTRSQLVSALRAARPHHVEAKADPLLAVLRAPGLRQPPTIEAAYPAVVSQVGIITALNEQVAQLQEVVAEHFGRPPVAEIYLSQPGLGEVLGARAPGEFGDDRKDSPTPGHGRTTLGKARSPGPRARNPSSWPGTPPTIASAPRFISRRSPRSVHHRVRAYYALM